MHRRRAREPLRRAFEGRDAPVLHVAHVDVERGFVELHDVDAERGEFMRLLVQRRREDVGELDSVAVMVVGDRVDDRHRSRQGEFELALGVPRAALASAAWTEPLRRIGPVTVGTSAW